MIWKIAKKEFLLNLMTFKFAVGTILCVVLMAVFMPVLVNDYQHRLEHYNKEVATNEAELRKVRVYKNIMPTIYRPPRVLSVFSQGLEKQLGNSAKIELDKVPEISAAAAKGNPYLSIFPVFDASLIFKIVISVLALLVAYDVISGERERGTLKLMLSGTAARYQVLLGKLLAGLMVLVVPISIAFITGLIILLSFPMVELNTSDWSRIGLMYVASLIFISAMYNLGLLFSCLASRSAISLVLGLFVWIVFAVVIPNGSVYLATHIRPLQPEEKMEEQLSSLAGQKHGELMAIRSQLSGGGSQTDVQGAFGSWYSRFCDKPCMEDYQKYYASKQPLEIKYADKSWEVERGQLSSLLKQEDIAKNLSRFSPVSLYENVMCILAGTDLAVFQDFTDSVRTYRNEVVEYIRSKTNNFALSIFFTPCRQEEIVEYERMLEQAKREKAWAGFKEWRDKKVAKTPPLDLQDFPQFTFQPSIARNLQRAIPNLALLIFTNLLFFVLSFVGFLRYDVRSD